MNLRINFTQDKKKHTNTITIKNGCNTHLVHILHKKHDRKFHLYRNLISRITNTVELFHEWVLKKFKHQEPVFY